MPTYGYQCTACENKFEVMQSIKDDVLTICESCGGSLRKLIYPVGIAFKGSGFYVNDYASKPASDSSAKLGDSSKPSDGAKLSADAKISSDSNATSSSETKPAAEVAQKSTAESKTTSTESKTPVPAST